MRQEIWDEKPQIEDVRRWRLKASEGNNLLLVVVDAAGDTLSGGLVLVLQADGTIRRMHGVGRATGLRCGPTDSRVVVQ